MIMKGNPLSFPTFPHASGTWFRFRRHASAAPRARGRGTELSGVRGLSPSELSDTSLTGGRGSLHRAPSAPPSAEAGAVVRCALPQEPAAAVCTSGKDTLQSFVQPLATRLSRDI